MLRWLKRFFNRDEVVEPERLVPVSLEVLLDNGFVSAEQYLAAERASKQLFQVIAGDQLRLLWLVSVCLSFLADSTRAEGNLNEHHLVMHLLLRMETQLGLKLTIDPVSPSTVMGTMDKPTKH